MKEPENKASDSIVKVRDSLLVLHHDTNTIGIVQDIDKDGNLIDISPQQDKFEQFLSVEHEDNSFTTFFSDFYHHLKNPEEFSFFKVKEYEAVQTGKDLQEYINHATPKDYKNLSQYEINIDHVEANKKNISSSKDKHKERYLYNLQDIDWSMLGKFGLSQQLLQNLGALEPMLKGYKTPMLVPVNIRMASFVIRTDARISLKTNVSGVLEPVIFPIRKTPDFKEEFYGHHFSKEDRYNLQATGNMGRGVDLIHPVTHEVIPSLISMDRLTNELIFYKQENIQIPDAIKGIQLTPEQQETLKTGKVLFLENMQSRRGTFFSAPLQFNAEKGYVEFLFNRGIKTLSATFRGKKLKY
ncbi:hypothetical protein CMT37_12830 [Elizabethkingia anophelis]|nr:hypothetical protein [Elizabethkingia anophelis]